MPNKKSPTKKTGRLREEEIFYIQHHPNMTDKQLADKLKRSITSVQKVVRAEPIQPVEAAKPVEAVKPSVVQEESIVEPVQETEAEEVEVEDETLAPVDRTSGKTENLGKVGGWVVMTPGIAGRADAPSVGDGTGTGAPQKFYSKRGTTGVRASRREA